VEVVADSFRSTGSGYSELNEQAAPSAGVANAGIPWFDTTDRTFKVMDETNAVSTTVRGATATSNQFLTHITAAGVQTKAAIAAGDLPSNTRLSTLGITVDGGGEAITSGTKGFIVVPFSCTIQNWSVVADQSGSIVLDVWKHTALPSNSNTITASAKPTLSAAQLAVAQAATGWTTAVSANDVIGFEVESATTVTRATLTIPCLR
jgi:hypothetical protein